jgi:esterase/lipase
MNALLALLGIVLGYFGALSSIPIKPLDLRLKEDAASDYEVARTRIEKTQIEERTSQKINPVCVSNFLSHGRQTEKVIVFFHGYTSCPEQFRSLGEKFFEQGYNVFIPRLPRHGPANRLSNGLAKLTAEELIHFANEAIDIARGLGEKITVAGLSGGGTMVLWLAQHRADIDLAVALAPFIGVSYVPTLLTHTATNWVLTSPNRFEWWDPKTRDKNPGVSLYSYPRYWTHASGEILRLGLLAKAESKRETPRARRILIITNAKDTAINNNEIAQIIHNWRRFQSSVIKMYEFDRRLNLNHDFITPERLGDKLDSVYQTLLDLMIDAK